MAARMIANVQVSTVRIDVRGFMLVGRATLGVRVAAARIRPKVSEGGES